MKQPPVPSQAPLSDLDLECLQTGRAMMLVAYRSIMKKISTQSDILEAQLRTNAPSNGDDPMSVRQALIRPAMARTLAIASGEEQPKKKRGRPKDVRGMQSYWATMTTEERSQEMQRRFLVRAGKIAKKPRKPQVKLVKLGHPRNAAHPGHAEWLAKMQRGVRKRWKMLSPEAREKAIAKMQTGKRKAAASVK